MEARSDEIILDNFERALRSLEAALVPPPANDRERDGAIQRFEYTFELSWKTSKKVLGVAGIVSNSPRSVIRDLAQQGLVDSAELWLEFLKARNTTPHIYNQEQASKVFESVKKFLPACRDLLRRLSQEISKG